jgi:tetratricopeptide (TPR) repeat protein
VEQALALNPAFPASLIVKARTLAELRRYDEALATLELLRSAADSPSALADTGRILALSGHPEEAEAILDRWPAAIGPGGIAQPEEPAFILLALGRRDEALALFEEAVNEGSSRVLWLREDPRADAVRAEPRFQALLDRIGGLD